MGEGRDAHRTTHGPFFVFCFLFVCLFFGFFRDRVSLCSPGCPGTHFEDQAGLELRDASVSAGIKGVCHHCPLSLSS